MLAASIVIPSLAVAGIINRNERGTFWIAFACSLGFNLIVAYGLSH
jgi:hypothetical protein